jgi:23S rRNA pseudouridine2605 synthase
MSEERIQKILAAAGVASRRKAEELIAAGRISVNGETITTLGSKADPRTDELRVDGALVGSPERHVYYMVYKPKGVMTTVSDPEGRPTVMDLIKGVKERLFPVGRLDYLSEGLLLMTNDGDLMARLTQAKSHVAKTYMVKVSGHPDEEALDRLREGITLPPEPSLTGAFEDEPGVKRRSFSVHTMPARIELAREQENPWYEVTLTEGRNRQIRRMFKEIGHHVEKIKRIRYATLELNVEPGEVRPLTVREVNELKKSLDEKPVRIAPPVKREEGEAEAEPERSVRAERPFRPAAARGGFRKPSPGAKVQARYERPGGAVRRSEKFISKTPETERPSRYSRGSGVGGADGRPRTGSSYDRPASRPYTRRDEGVVPSATRYDDSGDRTRRRTFDADGKPVVEAPRSYTPRPRREEGDRPARPYVRREEGGDERPRRPYTPRPEGGGSERPARPYVRRDSEGGGERRSYTPRPRREEGDRPARPYVRREEGGDERPRRPYTPRPEGGGSERPARPYVRRDSEGGGERRSYTPRPRREEGDRPARPYVRREEGGDERPRRPYTPRPEGGGRPSFGGKPKFGSRPGFGAKPKFGGRPAGRPSFGEGKPSFRPKSFDGPREGASGERRPSSGRPAGKSFGGPKAFGAKKSFGGPKSFGAKKSFGGGKGGSRGGKPSGGRGGKPPYRKG